MARKRIREDEEAAIDITPMMDIVFIMLIFFIVTTSFVKEAGIDVNKPEAARLAKRFYDIGFKIWATRGTSRYFNELNIPTKIGYKIEEETENLISLIQKGKVQYVVNTTTKGKQSMNDGFLIRRTSVENGVPCLTSMDTVEAMLKVIESMTFKMEKM